MAERLAYPDDALPVSGPLGTGLLVLLGILLVLLNGFFVAAEFALVKLRQTQADDLAGAGPRGRILALVRRQLDTYLSACQLGITLASLGLGWIGEPAFAQLLEPLLAWAGVHDPEVVEGISFTTAFLFISFLHIVLGELAPKSVAIRRAPLVALWTALPLYAFYWLMYPFIWVLNGAANVVVKRLGVEPAEEGDEVHSREELRHVLSASHRHGELGALETRLATRGLELNELVVGDVMRPISELVALDLRAPIESHLQEFRRSRFTRYPVRDGPGGRFVGLLHIKDLLIGNVRLRDIRDLTPYLRKLPTTEDGTKLPALLTAFREGSPHFALALDANGHAAGFVTFRHLVELILGPVPDEFARAHGSWRRDGDAWVGAASLSLLSLEEVLHQPLPEVDAYSVGGLLLEHLGRLPLAGERVRFPGVEIEVHGVDGSRIGELAVRSLAPETRASAPDT